ncbi:MAG: DUF4178 domain-containing protein [Candidatus Rokubacteria bacterium]|nr:DUF4178 domain-containing protein [Candidatus Rokubacteria bacterium]
MSPASRSGLEGADPRVGQTLRFDGREWEVTDHSSYWDAEGYRVSEWCCESEDTEAYLLKEVKEGEPTRWFFTRRIPGDAVTLPGGEGLPAWLERHRGAAPPAGLAYEGRSYGYAETTEGIYEDEPGERVRKATWEYWDAAHARNLAVERWEDGRADCYHGAYIEPGQVTLLSGSSASEASGVPGAMSFGATALRAASDAAVRRGAVSAGARATTHAPRLGENPFLVAAVVLPLAYVLPFFLGRPFDEGLAVALPIAALGGWAPALIRAPAAGGAAVLGLPVLAALFWYFPPLTSAVGLALLLGAPAAVAWVGRAPAGTRGRLPAIYAAAFVVALPALVLGLYHYFRFAPVPHSLGQLVLALGPAALGGGAACVVAAVILAAAGDRAS